MGPSDRSTGPSGLIVVAIPLIFCHILVLKVGLLILLRG
jgi:hypothetical protein